MMLMLSALVSTPSGAINELALRVVQVGDRRWNGSRTAKDVEISAPLSFMIHISDRRPYTREDVLGRALRATIRRRLRQLNRHANAG